MHYLILLTAALLPVLSLSAPLTTRAGGPAITPLSANCTLIDPLPHASQHPGNGTINNYAPSAAALNSTVYQFYLSQPDFVTYEKRYEQCLEQCNGLSGCVSVLFSDNAPTPKGYYGTEGGVPSVGCIMFGRYLVPGDFVAVSNSSLWTNETAANIYC